MVTRCDTGSDFMRRMIVWLPMRTVEQMTELLNKATTVALVHKPRERYYRFSAMMYTESRMMLVLSSFEVLKHTPAGVWIDEFGHGKKTRFVLTRARKRYACPTVEEALASYHARKKRQASILRYQLRNAEAALTLQSDGETVYI